MHENPLMKESHGDWNLNTMNPKLYENKLYGGKIPKILGLGEIAFLI